MDKRLELYKTWVPDTALWTQWAKPVVFMNLTNFQANRYKYKSFKKFEKPKIPYHNQRMVIVDLPGAESIDEGLILAEKGYRPVPLYNYVPQGKHDLISLDDIIDGLGYGAEFLQRAKLSDRANPVFLLDFNRLQEGRRNDPNFDNRWCVVEQDMPSADYLKKQRIKEIVVHTKMLQEDLKRILYKYQEAGISISRYDEESKESKISAVVIAKPQKASLFYRFRMFSGLARNSVGAFGMYLWHVWESNSSGGHYRAG